MSKREKEITAVHEAGHAILSLLVPEVDQVKKVPIIPVDWPEAIPDSADGRPPLLHQKRALRPLDSDLWADGPRRRLIWRCDYRGRE